MKISPLKYPTPAEYLHDERTSYDTKHEYYEGNVLEMPGASEGHNRIVANLLREIGVFIKDKPFDIFPSDFRVATPNMNTYVYPDACIVSGKPVLQDQHFDTLLNPSVIIEVLSTYSTGRDLGPKFFRYQLIPSVNEYIVIDSRSLFVQVATRQKNDSWKILKIKNRKASLFIDTIQLAVPLAEIYYRVDF